MQLIKLVQLGRLSSSGSDVEVIEFDNATDFHNEYSLSLREHPGQERRPTHQYQ